MQVNLATMKNKMEIPKKPGMKLSHDATIPQLGIYPEETIIEKDTGTPILIKALFST